MKKSQNWAFWTNFINEPRTSWWDSPRSTYACASPNLPRSMWLKRGPQSIWRERPWEGSRSRTGGRAGRCSSTRPPCWESCRRTLRGVSVDFHGHFCNKFALSPNLIMDPELEFINLNITLCRYISMFSF